VQSLLAKTLAERIAASTADDDDDDDDTHDTHDILRSVLVDEFYGASLFVFVFPPQMAGGDSPACLSRGRGSLSYIGKWHQRGEYQPAVGVLLITQGVDGDDGTGL